MVNVPPSSSTSTLSSTSPRLYAATATAQAPVPQALVMPTPRSHTRMTRWPRSRTVTTSTLVRAGNIGWASSLGPSAATSPANSTQCGLPTFTAAASSPSISKRLVSTSFASGIDCQSKRGAPMSTVTLPPPAFVQASRPPGVSMTTRSRSVSSIRRRATQRVALPQLSTSAVRVVDAHHGVGTIASLAYHDHLIAADPETPVGQGLRARRVEREPAPARVEDDEVVAEPVHFQEGRHSVYIGGCVLPD